MKSLGVGSARPSSACVRKVTFLAPDLVQRIVRGDHPLDLTADRLMDMAPLPEGWEAQRVLLGMSG